MFVNNYFSACNAYGIMVALYDCTSQPSNWLDVFLIKVSYVLGYKLQHSGCVNH